jgi:hypothetical protein
LFFLLIILILAGCAPGAAISRDAARALEHPAGAVPDEPPASCPVTQAPEVPFAAPAPYPAAPPERYEGQFWYGTPELWTMLGPDPVWRGLPQNRNGYSQKVFWWSEDFDVSVNPYPPFTLLIERLDAESAPEVVAEKATNASADFGTAMLTGVEIPSPGCWQITGQYNDAELSFVVWVTP